MKLSPLARAAVAAGVLACPAFASAVTLGTGPAQFEGLILEGTTHADIGVLLFHGRGQHPDGDVVRQLRHSLNRRGYTTLSIEDPLPSANIAGTGSLTSFQNYVADEDQVDDAVFYRLQESIQALRARNARRIVLAGFSLGSRFATAGAAAWQQGLLGGLPGDVDLIGLVGVGMYSSTDAGPYSSTPTPAVPVTADEINVLDTLGNLALISGIPVLDLYGDRDTGAAAFAPDRLAAFAGLDYAQVALGCPDFAGGAFHAFHAGGTQVVPYTENRCHQLRDGLVWVADTDGDGVPSPGDAFQVAVDLRGGDDAPLEAAVGAWFDGKIAPVPAPSAWLLFALGLAWLVPALGRPGGGGRRRVLPGPR